MIRREEGTAIANAITTVFGKLADYESSGLTPQEVVDLQYLAKNAGLMELLRMKDERPLTSKELQILYGYSVWVCDPDNCSNGEYGWVREKRFFNFESERFHVLTSSFKVLEFAEYNKSWIAYRCKPEEAGHDN